MQWWNRSRLCRLSCNLQSSWIWRKVLQMSFRPWWCSRTEF